MPVHILDAMARGGFEQVIAVHDGPSELRAFLAIHDTSCGPAFGGIRRWEYGDENRALIDCLRLARSMTFKCAWAGLPAGGAKMVILDRGDLDREGAYRHIGRVVESFGGRFYTGPDVGTGVQELNWVGSATRNVTSPGPDGPGNLTEATCAGVFAGMRTALEELDGEPDWSSRRVVVQGLGGVGAALAERLLAVGAHVIAAEIDSARATEVARRLEIELVEPGAEFDIACDVFSPCALGGIVHDVTLERLSCRIVAGGANNVLAQRRHGEALHRRDVLYVPDMILTAGALVRGATFHLFGTPESTEEIEQRIARATREVLAIARNEELPTSRAAEKEAERRIEARRATRS